MCILRSIDAVIWTIYTISQIALGLDFWLILFNVIATGTSLSYSARLLGVCTSIGFNGTKIRGVASENMNLSGLAVLWLGAQLIFWYADNVMILSIMMNVAIFVIAITIFYKLSRLPS